MTEMLRGVLASQATKVAGIIRDLPSTVGTLKDAATRGALAGRRLLTGRKGSGNLTLAPATPFNVSVGRGRAFAAVTLPLPAVKELGQRAGRHAQRNGADAVQQRAAPALRQAPAAAAQVAGGGGADHAARQGDTSPDNQASMSLISLGTHIADPLKRLAHVKAASAAMKSTMGSLKSILPTDFPSLGVPWLLEAATALYGKARVADRIPQVANVVISNVPGPPCRCTWPARAC
jgi:diacylglycerol O-acyltransferase